MSKKNERGGLDYCSICQEPLSLSEIRDYWETDGVCRECLRVIEETKDEFDKRNDK